MSVINECGVILFQSKADLMTSNPLHSFYLSRAVHLLQKRYPQVILGWGGGEVPQFGLIYNFFINLRLIIRASWLFLTLLPTGRED